MMPVQMHEVSGWADLKNGGDYVLTERSQSDPKRSTHGTHVPIIVCPKCLKPGSCSDHTLVQRSPLTIRASFLCRQRMSDGSGQDCGYHCMITDGVMTEC